LQVSSVGVGQVYYGHDCDSYAGHTRVGQGAQTDLESLKGGTL